MKLRCQPSYIMENSTFVKILGNSSMARVLEYLFVSEGMPVHLSDVVRNSNVSKVTAIKIWNGLIEREFILYDRTIGKAKLYKLNKNSIPVKKLLSLFNACLVQDAEEGYRESITQIPA